MVTDNPAFLLSGALQTSFGQRSIPERACLRRSEKRHSADCRLSAGPNEVVIEVKKTGESRLGIC